MRVAVVGAGSGKQSTGQRAVIEAGAADEEGHVPARVHLANDAIGIASILRRSVYVSRIGDVDQVMRNPTLFGARHFVGADIEAAIHGGGITVENLAANPLGKRQGQRALPGRGRSQHRHNDRLRAQSTRMNTYRTSTASTRMSPSCCVRVGIFVNVALGCRCEPSSGGSSSAFLPDLPPVYRRS